MGSFVSKGEGVQLDDHVRRRDVWNKAVALRQKNADCVGSHCVLRAEADYLILDFPNASTDDLEKGIFAIEEESERIQQKQQNDIIYNT